MKERVIEPSEIIVEQPNRKPKEDTTRINPWIRLLARGIDYSLFFLLLLASRKLFHGQLPFGKMERLIPFEFFVWIPIEALFLKVWGKTPGKFFMKMTLKHGKSGKFDYMTALRRSFNVWFRGLGMGIIVLNFFCLIIAYNKLKVLGITSWDRDDRVLVTHHPIKRWRIYVAVFVAAVGILYYYSEKNQELKNVASRDLRSIHEYSPSPQFATGPYFPAQDGSGYRSHGK